MPHGSNTSKCSETTTYICLGLSHACMLMQPHCLPSFSPREGVQIVWGNPLDPATFPSSKFDIVYDNNGKDMEACKPLIDTFKVQSNPIRTPLS